MESPLTQGRGLKRLFLDAQTQSCAVAPHTGAWIETAYQAL